MDTLLCLRESNICYLTGYEGFSEYVPQALILRVGDVDPILVLREMDVHCAKPTVYLDESQLETYPESYIGTRERTPWEMIGARAIAMVGDGVLGIELDAPGLSVPAHAALMKVLGDRKIVDVSDVVPQVRMRKSDNEIAYMKQSGLIADKAMKAAIDEIAVGVRQCDVAALLMKELIEGTPEFGGGLPLPTPSIPMTPAAAGPHLKWVEDPYQPNTQNNLEIGAFRHRYCCALSRTVAIGPPSDRLRYVHDAVLGGFHAALETIKPGVRCGDVYDAFAKAFFPKGVRKESRIGYSIGLDWGDFAFSLQHNDDTLLQTNYTTHLIIGIWENTDAYIFSETIRVGETRGESLSSMPRELFVR